MNPQLFTVIAGQFKVLAEPARLQILHTLMGGEMTVTELSASTGLGQANVSKHLQLLHTHGFVARQKDGLYTRYRVADPTVFALCDLMCGQLEREVVAQQRLLEESPLFNSAE